MKKLSKITESIWGNILDRGAGETVREEDKIFTNEELKNKIYNLYKEQGEGETLDVSSLTKLIKCDDFSYLFKGLYKVKHIIGIKNWNVSNVKDMHNMFEGCENFNCDLSNWDVSNVKDIHSMFWDCKTFNSDLSKWNVSSVEDMSSMFSNCSNFNSDLSNWDVSSVEDMSSMFADCGKFNSDLSNWDVSSVEDMDGLFYNCENFNSDLNNWDVSSVRSMSGIFYNCKTFNSDLSNWDVSNVKYMNSMFADCDNFNSDLSNWDISSVEYMGNMFNGCKKFNSDLSEWDVSNVTNMQHMFDDCKSLKQTPSWYISRGLNESIWGKILDRGVGDTVRKEDEIITNIKDIKPVDVGVSVLWADKDLEINDEKYILIDQVKNFEKDGWRLPSKDEADELLSNARWSSTKDNRTLSKFYQIGITHMKNDSEESTIYFDCELGKYSKYWENKRDVNTQKKYWDAFDFKHEGSFFPHSVFSRVKIDEPCRVRLVKDK